MHMLVDKMWPDLAAKLESPTTRWKRVAGPISAVVATLYQLGWTPLEPLKWRDVEGEEWILSPHDPKLRSQFELHLLRQVDLHLWSRACKHHYGGGLHKGVDLLQILARLRSLTRMGKPVEHAALTIVAQGGIWDPARLAQSQGLPIPHCPHCPGCVLDFKHMVWSCPHVAASTGPRITSTNHLAKEAVRQLDGQSDGYWMRGLTPWDYTFGKVRGSKVEPKLEVSGLLLVDSRWTLPPRACAGTDGSGGEHSRDPRLRQVGWGAAMATLDD